LKVEAFPSWLERCDLSNQHAKPEKVRDASCFFALESRNRVEFTSLSSSSVTSGRDEMVNALMDHIEISNRLEQNTKEIEEDQTETKTK